MTRVISLRRPLRAVLTALCGALLFASAAQAKIKPPPPPEAWDLAGEFPLTKQNPAPDKYGHLKIWFYSEGALDNPANRYPRMNAYFGPAEEEATCGVKEFHVWTLQKSSNGTPGVLYNAGPTVEEGQTPCAAQATFPTKTVVVAPEFFGEARAAVVRWRSPLTGTVTVSGSVQLVDSYPYKGITWQLDSGSTPVVGPYESVETNLMSFGPTAVPVVKGKFLNLEVGRAVTLGSNDSTAVTLSITSP